MISSISRRPTRLSVSFLCAAVGWSILASSGAGLGRDRAEGVLDDCTPLASTAIYLAMGWLVLVGIYPLTQNMSLAAFLWLLGGGVVYSIGAVVYALKWPDPFPKVFGFHEIFHIFVIGGSFCHFVVMYWYV